MENQNTIQNVEVAGPIQKIYKQVKAYLPNVQGDHSTVVTIDKSFENVLGECDKLVLNTTKRIKNSQVLNLKSYKNVQKVKKYVDQISQKVMNQIDSRLDAFIDQLEEKENLPKSEIQQGKAQKNKLLRIYKKSGQINRLVMHKVIGQISKLGNYNYPRNFKFMESVERITGVIYIEARVIYNVASQFLSEFLEKQSDLLKISYEKSKETVTMMINYKNHPEELKQKFTGGYDNIKNFTVTHVQKGLQIKINREFFMNNYKAISLKLIEIINTIKEKSLQNVKEVSVSSHELYAKIIRNYKVQKILLSKKKLE